MNDATVQRLLRLNREFYAQFADVFSDARPAGRVNLGPIMPYLADGVKVLDAGCGNGRTAARLDEAGYRLCYTGVDVTPALLARARRLALRHVRARFFPADITSPDWTDALRADAPFDLALALAVLHHIPSFALRRRVLSALGTLLRAGGTLVLSNWLFTRSDRLRRKVVPWSALAIDEREAETGDALLDWKRAGEGLRYVHLLTRSEIESLAEQSRFHVVEQSESDGELNLYSVLRRGPPT